MEDEDGVGLDLTEHHHWRKPRYSIRRAIRATTLEQRELIQQHRKKTRSIDKERRTAGERDRIIAILAGEDDSRRTIEEHERDLMAMNRIDLQPRSRSGAWKWRTTLDMWRSDKEEVESKSQRPPSLIRRRTRTILQIWNEEEKRDMNQIDEQEPLQQNRLCKKALKQEKNISEGEIKESGKREKNKEGKDVWWVRKCEKVKEKEF